MRNQRAFESLALLLLLAVLAGCSDDVRRPHESLDASADVPVDTDPTGTACEGHSLNSSGYDDACRGNVGCTQLGVQCGNCACTMCLDEACVSALCDDGGTDECPGSPWDDVGPDATDVDVIGDLGDVEVQSDSVDAETSEPQDILDEEIAPPCQGTAGTSLPLGLVELGYDDGSGVLSVGQQTWTLVGQTVKEMPMHEAVRFELEHPARVVAFAVQWDAVPEGDAPLLAGVYPDFGYNGFDFWHFQPTWEGSRCSAEVTPGQWTTYVLDTPIEVAQPGLVYVGHRREPAGPGWLLDGTTTIPDCTDCCANFDDCHSAWNFPDWHEFVADNTQYYFWPGFSLSMQYDYMVRLYVEYTEEQPPTDKIFQAAPGVAPNNRMAWGDFDDDGDDDLLLNGPSLWRNDGGGGFTDVTADSGISNLSVAGAGVWGDYDNDGCLDLFVFNESYDRSSSLLHGECDGTFTDVTAMSTITDVQSYNDCAGAGYDRVPTPAAAWWDLDGDGFLDLYMANMLCWTNYSFYTDLVWRNNGDGTFSNWTGLNGFRGFADEALPGRGANPVDYDQDGDVDLFVNNYVLEPNLFYDNNGDGTVLERGIPSQLDGISSWYFNTFYFGHTIGTAWGDLDNDGDFDVVEANLAHPRFFNFSDKTRIMLNQGDGTFADNQGDWSFPAGDSGLRYQETHSVPVLADFDQDGNLDLSISAVYVGRPTDFYWGHGDGTFALDAYHAGITVENGWGMATADYDLDGDLDLAAQGVLFENTLSDADKGHWLQLRAVGNVVSNRAAIGATVRAYAGARTFVRYVDGGGGQGCQNSQTVHFGLGDVTSLDRVEVDYPGAGTVVYPGPIAVDRRMKVFEDGTVEP